MAHGGQGICVLIVGYGILPVYVSCFMYLRDKLYDMNVYDDGLESGYV